MILLIDLIDSIFNKQERQPVCNYSDNYYGDQVCRIDD